MKAIIFSILAGLGFGGSMFLRKISVGKIGVCAVIFEALANVILAVIVISLVFPFNVQQIFSKGSGIVIAILGGLSLGIGVVGFFLAAKQGTVILPAVMGPTVGAIFSTLLAIIILKDSISISKTIGIIVAIIGLIIFGVSK